MSKLYQMISSDVLIRAPTRNDPNQLLEKSKVEASGIGQKMREEDKPTVGRGVGVSRMNQRLGSNKVPSEIPRHTQAPPPPPPPSQANNPALNQKFRLEAFDLLKVSDATFDFDEYQDFGMFDPNNSNNIYSNFTFGSSFGQQ
ncbi:hypothetical protein PPACK8108_LOCUS3087 [Phakopsora pachyrhizi]|uniref:Uncharacterized protein n=1 Tax=Phakopsora pachyrhizi TaxID=170000 RepID=A0AAV0AM77_PHAPC|nr:hypothetical protein PPACK8108_LOCUS3087 [Phakopsora pachyrhizi]